METERPAGNSQAGEIAGVPPNEITRTNEIDNVTLSLPLSKEHSSTSSGLTGSDSFDRRRGHDEDEGEDERSDRWRDDESDRDTDRE